MQFAAARSGSISHGLVPSHIMMHAIPPRLSTLARQANKETSATSSILHPAHFVPCAISLSALGLSLGTLLDAIHSNVGLQAYNAPFAVSILGMKSSLVVPPLLSVFYLTVGLLYLASDQVMREETQQRPKLATVLLGFLILSLELLISSSLYSMDVPFPLISAVLAAAFLFNWVTFDKTKQGLGLSILCGLIAPVAELLLMKAYVSLCQISSHLPLVI